MNTIESSTSDDLKSKYRWRLNIDEIQPFYLTKAQRPKYKIVQFDQNKKPVTQHMHFSFHDSLDNEMIGAIYEWVEKCNNPRNATLELLNKVGDIIERWILNDLKLMEADFGELDYAASDHCTIDIKVSCEKATLNFLKMENKTFSRKTA